MPALKNNQWEEFCQHYIGAANFNATEAARLAGYSKEAQNYGTWYTIGWEMKQRPEVVARIKELLKERRKEYDVTVERTIQEMARIAFSDITQIIASFAGGEISYKSLEEIPPRIRPAIKKIAQTQSGVTVEFYDKIAALEQLAKYFGMYEKDNKQKAAQGPAIYLPDNGRGDVTKNEGEVPGQYPSWPVQPGEA